MSLKKPPSPERLISNEIEKFMRDFRKVETEHGLQAALWQFAAQVYNTGSVMGGMIDPKYGPPAVVIEHLLQGLIEQDVKRGIDLSEKPLKSAG